jgi:hypothetical protein
MDISFAEVKAIRVSALSNPLEDLGSDMRCPCGVIFFAEEIYTTSDTVEA